MAIAGMVSDPLTLECTAGVGVDTASVMGTWSITMPTTIAAARAAVGHAAIVIPAVVMMVTPRTGVAVRAATDTPATAAVVMAASEGRAGMSRAAAWLSKAHRTNTTKPLRKW